MVEILNLIESVSEVFSIYSWDYENWLQSKIIPARESVSIYMYKLNSRDTSSIFGASAVKVLVLLFSLSIFVTAGH